MGISGVLERNTDFKEKEDTLHHQLAGWIGGLQMEFGYKGWCSTWRKLRRLRAFIECFVFIFISYLPNRSRCFDIRTRQR